MRRYGRHFNLKSSTFEDSTLRRIKRSMMIVGVNLPLFSKIEFIYIFVILK